MNPLWDAVKALPILQIAELLGIHVVKDCGSYAQAICIFHQDHVGAGGKPNLSLLKTKNGFRCFVCEAHGSVIDLYAKATGMDAAAAVAKLAETFHIVVDQPKPAQPAPAAPQKKKDEEYEKWDLERIQKAHANLLDPKNEVHLNHLLKLRLITKDYVIGKKIGLAWVPGIELCYTVPSFTKDGKVQTVRTHSRITRKDKRFVKGFTSKFLYDLTSFNPDAPEMHVVEGETKSWYMECVLKKNVITGLCGSTTLPGVFASGLSLLGDLAKKDRIVFYPDNDSPGELCMHKIRYSLGPQAKCFKAYWPADYMKKGSIDDWFTIAGKNEAELNAIIKPYGFDEAEAFLKTAEDKKKLIEKGRKVYEDGNCYFRARTPKPSDDRCTCEHKKTDHKQIGQHESGAGYVYGECSRKKKGDLNVACPCNAFEIQSDPTADGTPVEESGVYADRISNFVIRGRSLVKIERDVYTRADIITYDGKTEKDVFVAPDAFHSRAKILGQLKDPRYEFKGTDNDVMEIASWVVKTIKDSEVKKGVTYVGFVDDCFVGPGFAIDKGGYIENPPIEYVNQGTPCDTQVKVHPHSNPMEVLKAFCGTILNVNKPQVVIPTLGWFFACFFKDRIRQLLNYFPILSFFGTSGAGKTQFASTMMRLFGIKKGVMLNNAHQTTFVKDKLLASSNVVPVAVDEFKEDIGKLAIDDWKHRIRSSFSGEVAARGRQDLTIREFPFRAPLLVIGEMSVVREQAIAERTIAIEPKKSYIGNAERDAFKVLTKDIQIEALFLPIVQWVLAKGYGAFLDIWGASRKELTEMKLPWLPDRVWDNITVMAFGVNAIQQFAKDSSVAFHVKPEAKKEAIIALTSRVLEVAQRTKMGFDYLVEALAVMAKNGVVQKSRDYDVKGEWLYVHLPSCVPAFRKWARESNYTNEMLDEREYRNQAAEIERMQFGRYVYDVSKAKQLGEHALRTVQVNLKIAERFGLDVGGFGFSTEQVNQYEQDLPASGKPDEQLPPELTSEDQQQTLFQQAPPVVPAADQEDDIFGSDE